MNFSATFIRRPVATTLLTIGLTCAGILAYFVLPVSPLPKVDFPTIYVSASLPGADPETMATSVATPLERQLGVIAGVTEMTSVSSRGSTGIVLQFDLNRDINGAARDVQGAINAARSYLPANLPTNPTYRKVNPSEAPVLILSLTSETVGRDRMYDVASSILQQKLAQVDGVGQVLVGGGSLPAVRAEVNPTALNKYGITLAAVRAALMRTNANRPKGVIENDTTAWEIQTNDQLRKAEEYRPLIITYNNGAAVRLADVARVEDSVEDIRAQGLVNGKPSVMIIVFRQPEANIIKTVDEVRKVLPYLESTLPGGVALSVVSDRTPPIRGSLRDTQRSLVISVILVILVVFFFLRNLWSTFIPGVAVVTSLIGTFAAMYLLDYNLDNLSLMALTIATGFVVDDAIVVLENITRHLEKGLKPLQAALVGSKEIAFTVLSMSVSLVAVFIPILLMGGIVGRLFREFAVTLSMAVAISLVLSLTTTPMMCAYLLKPEGTLRHGRLYRWSERMVNGMRRRYDVSLRWALDHPRIMMAVLGATIALNIALFVTIPKGFFPEQDTGRIIGNVQADQGTSFQAMRAKLRQIVDIIRNDPDVENVAAFTGGNTATNAARMFISLKPFEDRDVTANQVIARLRKKLADVPGAPTFLQVQQELRVGGRSSGGLYQYTLRGDNLEELNAWSMRMMQKMRTLPQIADVNTDLQNKGLEARLAVDRLTASRMGITAQAVDEALYDAFGQRQVSVMYTLLNQYRVVMEAEPSFWQQPDMLRHIHVVNASGTMTPLYAFARFAPKATTLTVNHQGQFPAVTLSFNLMPGYALGDAVNAVQDASREIGVPATITGSFQGTAKAFQAAVANQLFLVLAALVTVYIVLGILYESFIHPVTILSTLPSAGVGAVLALFLFRTDLSVIGIIGVILLIGIVKKNGIMMVDFALEAERKDGKSPEEAIYEASLLRFRPIMMTTLAALLGAVPLALGMGIGAELRRPLGITIVGGLLISQMLTLYTTPVVYLYMDRFRLWLNARRGRAGGPLTAPAALAVLAVVTLGLSGCSVGPDYVRPRMDIPASYKEEIPAGWKVATPRDDARRGDWWAVYNDPALHALVAEATTANQNIVAAEARVRQAMAVAQGNRSAFYPTLTAGANYTRALRSANVSTMAASGNTYSDYQLPLNLSWEIDIWGRVRRLAESGRASADASIADFEAARLSVQAQVAQTYFAIRTLDRQKQILEATAEAYAKTLTLAKNRYASGVVSKADVMVAETQLKAVQAQAVDAGLSRAQLEHALAILCGKAPAVFSLTVSPLAAVPPPVPTGVPSALLERRPDIAGAERRMAAANAQIGVAKAAYYPTLTLGASVGYQANDLAKLLDWPSRFWSLGPGLSQLIFNGFLREALTNQAIAAYDVSAATYRQTVLTAFQEVEDNLAALRLLEKELALQEEAVAAAQQSLAIALNQYRAGTVGYVNVLAAQTIALNNEQTALNIRARRMTASVLLVKALGGNWDASVLNGEAEKKEPTPAAGKAPAAKPTPVPDKKDTAAAAPRSSSESF